MVKRLHTHNKILIIIQSKKFRLWSLLMCISELTGLIYDYKCKYIWDQIWKRGGGGKTDCMGIKNQSESMCSLSSRVCGHSGRQVQYYLFLKGS